MALGRRTPAWRKAVLVSTRQTCGYQFDHRGPHWRHLSGSAEAIGGSSCESPIGIQGTSLAYSELRFMRARESRCVLDTLKGVEWWTKLSQLEGKLRAVFRASESDLEVITDVVAFRSILRRAYR